MRPKLGRERSRRQTGALCIEKHQIGFRRLHRDPRDLRHPTRQRRRVRVILGQAFDVVAQRVDTGRRVHPALPHRSAKALLPAPGLADEILGTR